MPKITHADRKAWKEALIADYPGMEDSMAQTILWTYEHKADWMIAEMKRKQRLAKLVQRKAGPDGGQSPLGQAPLVLERGSSVEERQQAQAPPAPLTSDATA